MLNKYHAQAAFILKSFIFDWSLESLIRVQYEAAKRGISLTESLQLPWFEFEAIVGMIQKDIKEEIEKIPLL